MKILLVFNAHAAHGRAGKLLPDIKSYLREKEIEYDLHLTEYPGHALKLLQMIPTASFDGIVACGGDGTMFEAVNGYFNNASGRKPPLGILPIGTGNAFARELGMNRTNLKKAMDIIASGKTKPVDVGHFKMADQEFYFINILGFGFVSDIARTAHRLKAIGNIAYSLAVFYQLIRLQPFRLHIEWDGKILERDNLFVEISNTKFTGVNFMMAPHAIIDDGLLDITLLNNCTRRRVIELFPTIFKGEHIRHPEVETFQAQKIRLETDMPKVLKPDGELLGSTPIEVNCLKQALQTFSG